MIFEFCLTIFLVGLTIKATKRPHNFPPGNPESQSIANLTDRFILFLKRRSKRIASARLFAFPVIVGSAISTQGNEKN